MKFEEFPKEYEDVFTSERTLKKCDLDQVSTDTGMDINIYISKLHNTISDFQLVTFDYLVKIVWLFRRYCYRGKRRRQSGPNGIMLDGAFAVFMRRYAGFDARTITADEVYQKIIGYFDDFFLDFDISNPFENRYDYPYNHMRFEMLVLVYQMPERMELLKRGEVRKMGYTEFFDYVVNYINCYNDRHGKTYEFVFSRQCMPYIKKYEGKEIQTGDVR